MSEIQDKIKKQKKPNKITKVIQSKLLKYSEEFYWWIFFNPEMSYVVVGLLFLILFLIF